MQYLIYTGPGKVTATLTTDAPGSHYGIPVLRIEGKGVEDWPDLGPADHLPSGLTAAQILVLWATRQKPDAGAFTEPSAEGVADARRFCAQWPAGPQIQKMRWRVYQSFETLGDPGEELCYDRETAEKAAAELRRLIIKMVMEDCAPMEDDGQTRTGQSNEVEAWNHADTHHQHGGKYTRAAGEYIATQAVVIEEITE